MKVSKEQYEFAQNKVEELLPNIADAEVRLVNELVYSVIDTRHKSGKPMIVTTNLSGDDLKHPKDVTAERVYSRLFEMCIPIEVKGADRRKLKLRDADKDLKELLGLSNG